MTKSGDTTFAHIRGPAAQRPADAGSRPPLCTSLVCSCAVLRALKSQAPSRNPQYCIVGHKHNAYTPRPCCWLLERAPTCSRVQSICWRRHVSPSPALMSFAPIVCMHAFCQTTADTFKIPTKILVYKKINIYVHIYIHINMYIYLHHIHICLDT